MTYYKVLHQSMEDDGRLFSAVADYKYKLEYKLGEPTKPVVGTNGIFVFKDLKQALDFKHGNDYNNSLRVFECKVKNPRPLIYRSILNSTLINDFWTHYQECVHKHIKFTTNGSYYTCPEGTYIASEITITKEVS